MLFRSSEPGLGTDLLTSLSGVDRGDEIGVGAEAPLGRERQRLRAEGGEDAVIRGDPVGHRVELVDVLPEPAQRSLVLDAPRLHQRGVARPEPDQQPVGVLGLEPLVAGRELIGGVQPDADDPGGGDDPARRGEDPLLPRQVRLRASGPDRSVAKLL